MPVDKATAYPPRLEVRELLLVAERRRRERAGDNPVGVLEDPDDPKHLVGVALSGGGIRTATFSLGFLQAMARAGRLKHIDYLSTVSGGSYLGAFLGGLFLERDKDGRPGRTPVGAVRAQLADSSSQPVRWLRDNGRYLAPAADADALVGASTYLRNLLSIQVVMCVPFVAIFLAAFALRAASPFQRELEDYLVKLAVHGIWLSPYLALPVIVLLLGGVPLGAAYWLMPVQSSNPWRAAVPWLTALGIGAAPLVELFTDLPFDGRLLTAGAGLTVGWALLARRWPFVKLDLPAQRAARSRSSRWLSLALAISALLLGFALADTAGQTLYAFLRRSDEPWSLWTLVPAPILALFAALIRALFTRIAASDSARPGLSLTLLAGVAAAIVFTLYVVSLATLGHAVAWRFGTPYGNPGLEIEKGMTPDARDVALDPNGFIKVTPPSAAAAPNGFPVMPLAEPRSAWIVFGCALLLAIALGHGWAVLNLSTLQTLYAGRVTRAYLGASNPKRHAPGAPPLSDPIPGDDIPFDKYRPWESGGPLHLIGIAINETVSGETQTEYRDRRGIGFTVGPAGLSAGVHHHALWGRPASERQSLIQKLVAVLRPAKSETSP